MLGQPVSMLIPQVVGLPPDGQARRGRHRHRSRAHRHRDAAQEGRGRKVRRVLRPRDRHPAARRPRHHRQHGARVRRHLRHLPGGRGDAALPRVHRTAQGAGRAGRGVLQGAGAVSHAGLARGRLLRHAVARSRQRGAEPRRARAAPRTGCSLAQRGEELPRCAPDPDEAHVPHRAAHARQRRALGERRRRHRDRRGRAAAPHARGV